VRLSDALKQDAIAAGYVRPWKRTNAKRQPDGSRKRCERHSPSGERK
jgi:hypothetical protein